MTTDKIQEIIKCSTDLKYFGEKCTNIKLYKCHKNILDEYNDNNFVILQGIRGSGKTLINKIYALHYALFHPYSVISIAYLNNEMAKYGSQDFDKYIDNLKFLDITITKLTNSQISFSNGSNITFTTYDNPNAFRGCTINLLILEEFAYAKNDNIIDILYPCVAHRNSKMIISSTKNVLNRKTNRFWNLWCNAIDMVPECPFKPVYISIKDLPNKNQEWVNLQIKQMGKIKFEKEFEISYTSPNQFGFINGEKVYSPGEVAKLCGVSTSTVARWRTFGIINAIEISPRKYVYKLEEIERMIKGRELINIDKKSDKNTFYIDCGDLPKDIAQKYINELNERFKNQ